MKYPDTIRSEMEAELCDAVTRDGVHRLKGSCNSPLQGTAAIRPGLRSVWAITAAGERTGLRIG
jgi:hypothetical protein